VQRPGPSATGFAAGGPARGAPEGDPGTGTGAQNGARTAGMATGYRGWLLRMCWLAIVIPLSIEPTIPSIPWSVPQR
jgi:hypothetical protein